MKTECKAIFLAVCHSFNTAVCAGAVLLIASNAQAQNLFVTEENGNIAEITPSGVQSTFATGFGGPLAFNSAGNLFVGDQYGNIAEITPSGVQSTFAAEITPYAMAFDSAGNLFAMNENVTTGNTNNGGQFYEFTPNGVQSTFLDGGADEVLAMAFNSAGNLFLARSVYSYIVELTPDGVPVGFLGGFDGADRMEGLAFDSAGNLFVSDWDSLTSAGSIYEFTPGGVKSTFASGLAFPTGLAFNSAGDLFAADLDTGNIYEFTPGGIQSTFATGLYGPTGLAFQGETLPVPEPSTFGLLAVGFTALFVCRRKMAT